MQEDFLRGRKYSSFPSAYSTFYVIGYKKIFKYDRYVDRISSLIATLLIPCHTNKYGNNEVRLCGRKCRAKYAWVYKIEDLLSGEPVLSGKSGYGSVNVRRGYSLTSKLVYRTGRYVHCNKWETNMEDNCGGGIHFYLTKEAAQRH